MSLFERLRKHCYLPVSSGLESWAILQWKTAGNSNISNITGTLIFLMITCLHITRSRTSLHGGKLYLKGTEVSKIGGAPSQMWEWVLEVMINCDKPIFISQGSLESLEP